MDKKTLAIVALLLNILILPGVGSLVAGRNKEGVWQLVLTFVGILLLIVVIGMFIIIGAWIWGLITGIQLVQEA